jgi:3-methyl-2-oxobutanoate hydroxymethyltransferase
LLECVPAELANEITCNVEIPVIGIGAGPDTDAQVLVLQDILGITPGKPPSFSRNFMQDASTISDAISRYVSAVRQRQFPAAEHTFK